MNIEYWYALYTMSNRQIKVRDYMNTLPDVIAYLPTKMVKRSHARKIEEKEVPIIPSYVFFYCQPQSFRDVSGIPGVSHIVRKFLHTGEYVKIRDVEIRRIQEAMESAPDKVKFEIGDLPFHEGTDVIITGGPFKDYTGVVSRIDNAKATAIVYLTLANLGYATLEVDVWFIQPQSE